MRFLKPDKARQHLLCGQRLARRELQESREEQCSSRAMRSLHNHIRCLARIFGKPTRFLLIVCRRTLSPAIAHAGDRGSASHRVALPKPSRVEELPISAYTKYGSKQSDPQRIIWSFDESRKSLVTPYDFSRSTLAAWTLATRSQFTTDFWGAQNKDDISPGRTAPAANTGTFTQSFLLFPEDAGRCNGQAKA